MSTRLRHPLGCDGKVLRFVYGSGSNPGSTRLVYVLGYKGIRGETLQCWDFDKKEPRCFSASQMGDIAELEKSVRKLEISSLPAGIDIALLVKGYVEEGCDVYYDSDVIVSIYRPKPQLRCILYRDGSTMRVTGREQLSLTLSSHVSNPMTLEVYAGKTQVIQQRNPTPTQLRDALNRVIDG